MNALLVVAMLVLIAAWTAIVLARRRAARRAAELQARLRARRRRVPVASANVRGLEGRRTFITFEEMDGSPGGNRAV